MASAICEEVHWGGKVVTHSSVRFWRILTWRDQNLLSVLSGWWRLSINSEIVNQPQRRRGGVAEPTAPASANCWCAAWWRLSLELGVAGSNFLPLHPPKFLLYSVDLRLCKISRRLTEMEMSRYSIKSNAGRGLIGFVTNFSITGEFDLRMVGFKLTGKLKRKCRCIKSH